jgi:hypothetical protein
VLVVYQGTGTYAAVMIMLACEIARCPDAAIVRVWVKKIACRYM